LKVLFNLEGQFDSSTGEQMSQPGNSQIFRRQANVGLSGRWGMLQFGRLYSPLVWATKDVEPRTWKEQFSQIGQLANNQLSGPGNPLGAGSNDSNDVGTFIGNAVLYSHNIGPFYVGIGYGFGEQPGDFDRGGQIALGASYSGPITVGMGYHKVKDSVTGVTIHDYYDIGTAVTLGEVTARLHYIHAKNNDPASGHKVSDVDSIGLGVDLKWDAGNAATIAYYHNRYDSDPGDSTTRSLVLGNDFALSKRTVLYAQVAYEDSDAAVNPADPLEYLKRTIVVGGTAPAGKETAILSLGVMHNF
jgi:predicted porin